MGKSRCETGVSATCRATPSQNRRKACMCCGDRCEVQRNLRWPLADRKRRTGGGVILSICHARSRYSAPELRYCRIVSRTTVYWLGVGGIPCASTSRWMYIDGWTWARSWSMAYSRWSSGSTRMRCASVPSTTAIKIGEADARIATHSRVI